MTNIDCQDAPCFRVTKGRRGDDYKKNIEVHPIALSAAAGFLTVVLTIAGYFFKSWADNITYELRQFRIVAERQLVESAAQTEWKNDMRQWRGAVDSQLKDIDNRMDTLPWSVPRKSKRHTAPNDGGSK